MPRDRSFDENPELREEADVERARYKGNGSSNSEGDGPFNPWAEPDMAVLRLHRRLPPQLPMSVVGPVWEAWISATACPPDYVLAPLLASVSALIGHASVPSLK